MSTPEKFEQLRELTATCISMLKDLHDNVGFDQLECTLQDVLDEALELEIIDEEEAHA